MMETTTILTDVLVIGGGIAGTFAALSAKKQGADVLLVDKGYVSSTGQTPYAGTFLYFDPAVDDKETWIQGIRRNGDYLANLDFTEQTLDHAKDCADTMMAYGVEFMRDDDSGALITTPPSPVSPCRAAFPKVGSLSPVMRKAVIKEGITIMDRVMMVDLLVEDDTVCGAVGITVTGATPVVIHAKRVVLCTGASALKPPSWPVSNLTGDGDMMAYRKGVPLTGKEFLDTHPTTTQDPSYMPKNTLISGEKKPPRGQPMAHPKMRPIENALGQPTPNSPNLNLGHEFEVHAGRGPILSYGGMGPLPAGHIISCASSGMACHKTEGLWPEGLDCSTALKGLYAAGDCLGGMMSGAAYSTVGLALTASAVTGKMAGLAVGEGIAAVPHIMANPQQIEDTFQTIYTPLNRKSGFSPKWLIQYLQNLMMPYSILIIKKEDRLQATLTQVRWCKEHVVPRLWAKDDHDLRLAIEAKNMVQNVEIKLIAAMARKESRGTHYREDYPDRNEEEYSCWFTVRKGDEESAVVESHKVPEEWAWHEGDPRLIQFPTTF